MQNILADVYSIRFIKPFDFDYYYSIARDYDGIVLVEDGIQNGGISEYIFGKTLEAGFPNVKIKAFESKFYSHGTRSEVCMQSEMTSEDLTKAALSLLDEKNK